jgi:outer membrane protein assembly factor BamB
MKISRITLPVTGHRLPTFATGCLATLLLLEVAACHHEAVAGLGGTLRQNWLQTENGYGQARPAVLESKVFFTTGDGNLVARRESDGVVVWKTRIAAQQIRGYNAIAREGTVVVPVTIETVGVDATSGEVRWRYLAPLDTVGTTTPAPGNVAGVRIDADDSTVYLPAWGASVSAIDLTTGQARWVWRSPSSSPFRAGAVGVRVSGDTVFVGVWHFLDRVGLQSEPWVVALDRTTGRELWRTILPNYVSGGVATNGAPALLAKTVVVSGKGGDAWGLSRTTGELLWYRPPTPSRIGTVAEAETDGTSVFIDSGERAVYALNPSDGTTVWRADFSSGTAVDLLASSRYLYASNGPTLSVYDRTNGRLIALVNAPSRSATQQVFGSPGIASDGHVFITVSDAAWSFEEP